MADEDNYRIIWEPGSAPQYALLTCPVFEVLFGGARGGGKTDGMLGEWVSHADEYGKNAIGLMIRRTRVELVETIERSKALYTQLGWTFHESEKMWRSPQGARLRFAYLERDSDADGYQGHSYTRIYIEEVGNFPDPKPVLKLMATLRSGAGVPVGMRLTANPGGAGHNWVRSRYIDPAPAGYEIITDPKTGLQRVFIPSKVTDNKYLGQDYVQQLKASGSETLVRAWLEGDWSVIEGAFFDFQGSRHVLPAFSIPDEWIKFRSFDWGYASPFSVGWWAVVGDKTVIDGRILPRGALVRYREWYGSNGTPNVGLRLANDDIARGILMKERDEKIAYGVADPSIFNSQGGPTIAEQFAKLGVFFKPGDNARVPQRGAISGWSHIRQRLKGDGDGNAMLFVFDTCREFIRTVPVLQHDPDKPEDVMTDSEDHIGDEARYGCASRPWINTKPKEDVPERIQFWADENGQMRGNMTPLAWAHKKERDRKRASQ